MSVIPVANYVRSKPDVRSPGKKFKRPKVNVTIVVREIKPSFKIKELIHHCLRLLSIHMLTNARMLR